MPSYSLHFLEECFKLNHLIAPLFAYLNDAPAVTNKLKPILKTDAMDARDRLLW